MKPARSSNNIVLLNNARKSKTPLKCHEYIVPIAGSSPRLLWLTLAHHQAVKVKMQESVPFWMKRSQPRSEGQES